MIDDKEVRKIAKLARISLGDDEIHQIGKDLNAILDHFSNLQKVETGEIKATDNIMGLSNRKRDDLVTDSMGMDKIYLD